MFGTKIESINKYSQINISGRQVNNHVVLPLFLFVLLNTLKITSFNLFIVPDDTIAAFMYKYSITFLLLTALYIAVIRIKSRLIFGALYLIQTLYVFANLAYFIYFRDYLHLSQSSALLVEGLGAAGHFSVPKSPELLIILIDMPFFVYLLFNYNKISRVKAGMGVFRPLTAISCVLLVLLIESWNYSHDYSIVHLTKDFRANEPRIIERYGTFLNSVVDLSATQDENTLIKSLKYGKELSSDGKSGDKPNFVVIQVESMDAGVVNQKYKGEYIAPFLNSLSRESVYYPYMLSYHMAGGTSDSEFSIVNSIEPLNTFPSIKIKNFNYPNSFVKRLAKNSYSTIAFHGNTASYFDRGSAYARMGYQAFDDMKVMGLKDIGWGAPDNDVFKFAENRLKTLPQPFLNYTITMTSHGPFTNARYYYNNPHYNDIENEVVRNYLNSMSYVDQSIQDYVTYIRNNFNNTYIFIFGDHTPNINTDVYRQASFIEKNKYFEFVPLMIVTPDNKIFMEDRQAASFLDIAPTILEASGVPYSIRTDGFNLLDMQAEGGKIPFKGQEYDRSYLFDKASGKIK